MKSSKNKAYESWKELVALTRNFQKKKNTMGVVIILLKIIYKLLCIAYLIIRLKF